MQHTACYVCNGFYGPSFNEPVCPTCHAFLYPEDWSCINPMPVFTEKTDDGDSGNDEPSDMAYAPVTKLKPPQNPVKHQLTTVNSTFSTPQIPDGHSPSLVDCLPPEVLLVVFSYLDDMSLWSVGNVCKRWHHLLKSHMSDHIWRVYTQLRFPIYKPFFTVKSWFKVYTRLMNSCPCKACLLQMSIQSEPPGVEDTWRSNRLSSELKSLKADPPQGIEAVPLDPKYCHWQASITGPVGSPYEGGLFYLYLQVPYSYPMTPPIVKFLTRIFHPNVSRHGDVGIDSIHHNWTLALTISKILISVQSLLTDPFCEVCMEPGVGKLYMKDKIAFGNIARTWTWKYAMNDVLSPCT
ncbi:hypothetical protein AAG570_007995 [Ranatra chinensis]|uniref:E2 ubiquitin-conjugating enzyme n=1 Tax=Ranatra chinensis TaxID=642074 RepID=A0ABD0XTG5_9HEMI